MNVDQLDVNEKQAFLTWRRKLARLVLFLPHLQGFIMSQFFRLGKVVLTIK